MAQFNLGLAYDNGEGGEKNLESRQMVPTADQGYAGAQHNLGVAYDNGDGVERTRKPSNG